jgi:uncharacterized membrane protein
VSKGILDRWQANFLTGLVILLPALLTFLVANWIFKSIASITDVLLFFLPNHLTHGADGNMYWYWSLVALVVAVVMIGFAGFLARYYVGRRMIAWLDATLLRVPLLNKVYGTIKQVNEAFTSGKKSSFKTVVLIEFPHSGTHSIGFLTGEPHDEFQLKTTQRQVCVFVPATPNPTSGFLMLVPENKVTRLDMSVAEGIKYIISLGAIGPDSGSQQARETELLKKSKPSTSALPRAS